MGTFKELHEKHVNNGIFIALLVLFAAGIAVWWYSNREQVTENADNKEHPLAEASSVSLCELIPKLIDADTCQDSEQQPNVAGHSIWSNAEHMPVVRMDVITTKNLSIVAPITSKAWFESILPEIKSSGRKDWAEPTGSWSKAVITRKEDEQEMLFEDDGIVVVMQSTILDRKAMLTLAGQIAKTLRKATPVISSEDAATQK